MSSDAPMPGPVSIKVGRRLFVPVYLEHQGPFYFLMDTGGGLNVSTRVAEHVGLEVYEWRKDEIDEWCAVGSWDPTYVRPTDFVVANVRWEVERLAVGPNDRVEKLLGRPVDGWLGGPFLDRFEATINYPAKTVEFRKSEADVAGSPSSARALARGATHKLELFDCAPFIPSVCVNGRGPYRFVLDTGASQCSVAPQVAEDLDLPRGKDRRARGIGTDLPAYESRVSSLAVGEASVRDFDVMVSDRSHLAEQIGLPVHGTLGTTFLEHFTVVLNYQARTVGLMVAPSY